MERTIISFDYAIKSILRDKANFTVLNGFLSELLNKQVVVEEMKLSKVSRTLKARLRKLTESI